VLLTIAPIAYVAAIRGVATGAATPVQQEYSRKLFQPHPAVFSARLNANGPIAAPAVAHHSNSQMGDEGSVVPSSPLYWRVAEPINSASLCGMGGALGRCEGAVGKWREQGGEEQCAPWPSFSQVSSAQVLQRSTVQSGGRTRTERAAEACRESARASGGSRENTDHSIATALLTL
jgi:hypothetical protein